MERRLHLSNTNKKIAGVCGGMGEYFNIDPTVIRVLWVLSVFLHGVGLLAYFVAWLVMPRSNGCSTREW